MAFKSKLEEKFYKDYQLPYEQNKLPYTISHTYSPDFKVAENVFIETKGRFTSEDRSKIKAVIYQHPEIMLALVFQNPNQKLNTKSKTTYSDWADKLGITWFGIKDKQGIQNFIRKYK